MRELRGTGIKCQVLRRGIGKGKGKESHKASVSIEVRQSAASTSTNHQLVRNRLGGLVMVVVELEGGAIEATANRKWTDCASVCVSVQEAGAQRQDPPADCSLPCRQLPNSSELACFSRAEGLGSHP